jgi:vacuolar-type H+-ATPase subunit F/Vma7
MKARDLVVIASQGSGAGMALAGVGVVPAANAKEAARALEELDEKVRVVMIDERLYDELPEELRRSLNRTATPVVIPVPGPDWTDESRAHEYIVQILRRAIGYRVRLQ